MRPPGSAGFAKQPMGVPRNHERSPSAKTSPLDRGVFAFGLLLMPSDGTGRRHSISLQQQKFVAASVRVAGRFWWRLGLNSFVLAIAPWGKARAHLVCMVSAAVGTP